MFFTGIEIIVNIIYVEIQAGVLMINDIINLMHALLLRCSEMFLMFILACLCLFLFLRLRKGRALCTWPPFTAASLDPRSLFRTVRGFTLLKTDLFIQKSFPRFPAFTRSVLMKSDLFIHLE